MTKRLVEIDDELLDMARKVADAETIKGTVEEALRTLVRIEMVKRHIEQLGESLDPAAVELLAEARRVEPPPDGFSD